MPVRWLPPDAGFGLLPGDVAYEELWTMRRFFLAPDLLGTFNLFELKQLVLAVQRHYASSRMRLDEKRRVLMTLEHLGPYIGITVTPSGATTTLPLPTRVPRLP